MSIKLPTEHQFDFLSLKGGWLHRLVWVYACQNAALLEITCGGSFHFIYGRGRLVSIKRLYNIVLSKIDENRCKQTLASLP